MNGIEGLDQPCPACERVAGDHTLREWHACLDEARVDMPAEAVPQDARQVASEQLRRMFDLDGDVVVADHVVVRSVTLTGASGPVTLRMPGLLHEFAVGLPGSAPERVARVLFVGDDASLRGYGRLVRDSSVQAITAATGER
jgi:hypothetical protein